MSEGVREAWRRARRNSGRRVKSADEVRCASGMCGVYGGVEDRRKA